MSLDTLKRLTDEVSKCLSLKIDRENGDEVSGVLQDFILMQSTASEAMSLASMVYAEKMASLYEDQQYSKLSATDKKAICQGRASKEIYYVSLTERLSRSLSHGIDGYRSILSDLKEQRRNHGI